MPALIVIRAGDRSQSDKGLSFEDLGAFSCASGPQEKKLIPGSLKIGVIIIVYVAVIFHGKWILISS